MKLFPPIDASMRLRMQRQGMALVSYLMFFGPLAYAVHNHWMKISMWGLAGVTAGAVAVNALFFLLIRSGYSARFKDASLTLPQIAASLAMALLLIRFSDEARPVFLMLFFASFFFGVFGLTRRRFWQLAIVTILGYATVVASEFWVAPPDSARFKLETLQFIALSMILCWMAAIGGYVANLRQNVANKKAELASAVERLRLLVSHDELTGVFNRRHLLELLEHEKACAIRHKYVFSLCLLDIDHFKSINDTYGHQVGDEVLREFSSRMRQNARKMDWLARSESKESSEAEVSFGRYGGEEFMVVMPHTPSSAACLGVERLRVAIQVMPIQTSAGPLEVRFSAGVAQYRPGESIDATIARADKALYRAKQRGRNQTQVALGLEDAGTDALVGPSPRIL